MNRQETLFNDQAYTDWDTIFALYEESYDAEAFQALEDQINQEELQSLKDTNIQTS